MLPTMGLSLSRRSYCLDSLIRPCGTSLIWVYMCKISIPLLKSGIFCRNSTCLSTCIRLIWNDFLFRVSSTSFTIYFECQWVMYIGGGLSLFVGDLPISVLPCKGQWLVRDVSGFLVALSLEMSPLRPFRWAAPGSLRVQLMMEYLSVHLLFSSGLVTFRPERSYAYLLYFQGFRSFSLLLWILLLLFEGVVVSEIGLTLVIAIR